MKGARLLLVVLPMLALSGCYLSVNDDDYHENSKRTHCSVSCGEDGRTEASCPKDKTAVCSCDPKPSATCSAAASRKD